MAADDEATRKAEEAQALIEMLGLKPGWRVLDVGCGAAHHAFALAQAGLQIAALDISRRTLAEGRARARELGLQLRFIEGDARELRFREEFDAALVLWLSAFSETPADEEDEKILDGLCRSLVPEGKLVLDFWHAPYALQNGLVPDLTTLRTATLEGEPPQQITRHCRWYVAPEVTAMLARAGFEALEYYGKSFDTSLSQREPLAAHHPLGTVIAEKVVRVVRVRRKRRRHS